MPSSKRPSSEELSPPALKRRRSTSICSFQDLSSEVQNSSLNIYLLDAKLKPDAVEEISALVDKFHNVDGNSSSKEEYTERELQLCPNVEDADVIITVVHMRKRLERHVDWNIARRKAIVTPQWLRDSVESGQLLPCGRYAALGDLYEETVKNCPDASDGSHCQAFPEDGTAHRIESELTERKYHSEKDTQIRYHHRYACMRHSPLICPNQGLVEKLAILRRHREIEGFDMQSLSYERVISVLKAFPYHITLDNIHEVSELPHIGSKICSKIQEFIKHGDISECKSILSGTRYHSLVEFTTVYGIGPATARNLYSLGLRTIKDLENHYKVSPQSGDDIAKSLNVDFTKRLPQLSIKVGLALREDLRSRIPRSEVEEIHGVVMNELANIRSGCVSTITGGYRRGKDESNDVDIVISHKDLKSGGDQVKELCAQLVKRLHDKGLVTHVMHLSGFREHNALRTTHWDSLEKALTVFILPDDKKQKHVHRRLDLIFAAPEVYWTAVVGWTGSKMFERDLRLWAKQERGMRFDSSGISRRHDSKLYFPNSEQEVFELLGLEWIHPTLRNADL
ncbi:DNA polymerase mu [Lentinula edodes]|nr:DNA polymerase mu [Lentinula edodes]